MALVMVVRPTLLTRAGVTCGPGCGGAKQIREDARSRGRRQGGDGPVITSVRRYQPGLRTAYEF